MLHLSAVPGLPFLLFALVALGADAPAADRYGDPLPAGARTRLGTVRFRHPGHGILALAALNNQTVVSVGETGRICFWDIATGKLVRSFPGGEDTLRAFALARDGRHLAVAGIRQQKETDPFETVVRILDAATGKVVRQFERGTEHLERGSLAFSADGKLLFSISTTGVVRIEEIDTGFEILREKVAVGGYPKLALSPDGKVLALFQSKVYLWEWESGNPPAELGVGGRGAHSVIFTPDSKTVLTSPDYGAEGIRAWNVASRKLQRTVGGAGESDTLEVSLSSDGKLFVTVSHRDRTLIIHDFSTGKELRRWKLGDSWRMGAPQFTPDSRRLAAAVGDGTFDVWDVTTGKEVVSFEGHRHSPSFVAFLPGGTAMTASDDGTARLWDARTGEPRQTFSSTDNWFRGSAVSPNGKWLATSELGRHHAVRLWEIATGKQVYRLAGHGKAGGNRALRFTPDSRHLLSWGDDMYLRRWDVRNGKAIDELAIRPDGQQLPSETDEDNSRRFDRFLDQGSLSADGHSLVLGSHNLYLFDTRTGKQTRRFTQDEGTLIGFAISPDGTRLLCGSWGRQRQVKLTNGQTLFTTGDRVVCLYDLVAGKQLWRREVGTNRVSIGQVALSPDGKSYALGVGSAPARIEFGDLLSGKRTHTLEGVPAEVRSLAYSEDGKQILSGLQDTTALIWDVPSASK